MGEPEGSLFCFLDESFLILGIKDWGKHMKTINWYPGHMKKTRELIQNNLKMVDVVIEVIDARIPVSSRNPIINQLIEGKPRVIVLNKKDLSDPNQNKRWIEKFAEDGHTAIELNCMSGEGVNKLYALLEKMHGDTIVTKLNRPLRMMIVGVPNAGKSSLINRMTGKKSTQTGDRPGVTKGKQWLTLSNGMQLLDTPGILWPKFEDPDVGLNLAYCGSIKEEILDVADLALSFIEIMEDRYPQLLMERYKLEELGQMPLETMEEIARKRGFILPGKRIDYERCARTVMDEFRSGKIGKITLEEVK